LCELKYCVVCIARCEMQAVMRNSDHAVTVELVTLFTQKTRFVTPSKYTNNCHCTCKLYDYCPVGANKALWWFGICTCRTQTFSNRMWSELQANYYTVGHFMDVEYCKPLITSLTYARWSACRLCLLLQYTLFYVSWRHGNEVTWLDRSHAYTDKDLTLLTSLSAR